MFASSVPSTKDPEKPLSQALTEIALYRLPLRGTLGTLQRSIDIKINTHIVPYHTYHQ